MGAIINSSDELVEPGDLVKLQNVLELNFTLEGMHVVDDHRSKLGKVVRYAVDPESFVIQQLHVKRPLLKSFNESELLIHRKQIIAISHDTITVKSADLAIGEALPKTNIGFDNPFRQSRPKSVEATETVHD
jgi:hypothetical protein